MRWICEYYLILNIWLSGKSNEISPESHTNLWIRGISFQGIILGGLKVRVTKRLKASAMVRYFNISKCLCDLWPGISHQALIWIVLLIVGAVVLLGLFILLAWKCWTIYAVSTSSNLNIKTLDWNVRSINDNLLNMYVTTLLLYVVFCFYLFTRVGSLALRGSCHVGYHT